MDDDSKQQEVLALTTEIVASFVGRVAGLVEMAEAA